MNCSKCGTFRTLTDGTCTECDGIDVHRLHITATELIEGLLKTFKETNDASSAKEKILFVIDNLNPHIKNQLVKAEEYTQENLVDFISKKCNTSNAKDGE